MRRLVGRWRATRNKAPTLTAAEAATALVERGRKPAETIMDMTTANRPGRRNLAARREMVDPHARQPLF
jgi:hypothetical protein